ncbi:MAG TPA: hypothetical protein VFA34_00220 [Actinomycetota bacterium]|jgi:hypothetical protein|nr:hypothetical protein [Actinomycetota bacterium]
MIRFKAWSSWILVPRSMRRASVVAALILFASSALLYQTNIRGERAPKFGRGGAFAGTLTNPGIGDDFGLSSPGPTPIATRSSAILFAPGTPRPGIGGPGGGYPFPTFATYVYAIKGYEEATAFGRRDYPSEMTTTVHRTQPTDPNVPRLQDDEVIFDLFFSTQHEEREIVSFRDDAIAFTYEAGSVTFGPATQTSEAVYDPPMLQIPVPLEENAIETGTSVARDSGGNVRRTEDWTVEVLRRERLNVLGSTVNTWVVKIDRQSRPGGAERVTRSRTYWFDPGRSIWVKWEETLSGAQDIGPGDFSYRTQFTATLKRLAPV